MRKRSPDNVHCADERLTASIAAAFYNYSVRQFSSTIFCEEAKHLRSTGIVPAGPVASCMVQRRAAATGAEFLT